MAKDRFYNQTKTDALLAGKANSSDVDQLNTRVSTVEAAIEPIAPSTDASDNALAGAKSTAQFVNSSINAFAAFYITSDAQGHAFSDKAALNAAIVSGEFYNGGEKRSPTKNDYLIILKDESITPIIPDVKPTTRYSYDGSQWAFQYVVNNTALTQAQIDAINSGITAAKVAQIKQLESSVTLSSENPVKSSGIWSAIWGDLSSIPYGLSSQYEWTLSCLSSDHEQMLNALTLEHNWASSQISTRLDRTDIVAPSISAANDQAADAKATYEALSNKANIDHTQDWNTITSLPAKGVDYHNVTLGQLFQWLGGTIMS